MHADLSARALSARGRTRRVGGVVDVLADRLIDEASATTGDQRMLGSGAGGMRMFVIVCNHLVPFSLAGGVIAPAA